MNKNDFIRYIRQPEDIRNINVGEINYLLEKFPYFQSAHLVYSAYLSSKDDISFHDQLKLTAAHVNDRAVLYWLIYNQEAVSTTEPITSSGNVSVSSENISIAVKESITTETDVLTVPELQTKEQQEIISTTEVPEQIEEVIIPQETETQTKDPQEYISITESTKKEDGIIIPKEPEHQIKELKENISKTETQKPTEEAEILPVETKTIDEVKPESVAKDEEKIIQEAPKKPVATSYNQPETFLLSIISKRVISNQIEKESSSVKPLTQKPVTVEPEKTPDLIDKFIKEEPRLSQPRRDFFNPMNMAENSSIDKEDIVSETLAKIYISQGLLQKALKIYQKLYLFNPEKSTYFAAQIENLESKINN